MFLVLFKQHGDKFGEILDEIRNEKVATLKTLFMGAKVLIGLKRTLKG